MRWSELGSWCSKRRWRSIGWTVGIEGKEIGGWIRWERGGEREGVVSGS